MPGEKIPPIQGNDKEENRARQRRKIEINELSGRVCYFSLAGNLALEAFSQIRYSTFRDEIGRAHV